MTDGSQLEDVWGSILPAKFIKDVWLDVEAKKPEDWDDLAKINDAEGTFFITQNSVFKYF